MILVLKRCIAALTCILLMSAAQAQELAENLYTDYKEVLYQIKIIDKESSQKSTIGSGFLINATGLAVTNYHVVSDYILSPDKNHIEVEDISGNKSLASLVSFDVVNDLALIQIELSTASEIFLPIAESLPTQGTTIYSLGNPHDLGMIVVPGTYNGLKKHSFYQKIHFTGSVNSGMSGGPVINESGHVIGVNVASAGNQLGFLVPLSKLKALVQHDSIIQTSDYKKVIAEQLTENQSELIKQLSTNEWPSTRLGMANVPDAMSEFISCWGDSNVDNQDAQFLSVRKSCSLDQTIYVSNRIQTGHVGTQFQWFSSDKLDRNRFYQLIDQRMNMHQQDFAHKQDFSEYECQLDTIKNKHDVQSKSALCVKSYKEFAGLFDIVYVSATIDQDRASLISQLNINGITQASFEKLVPRFIDAVSWQ
ncbi:serine protease [Glaciecola sp. SC05]|uniref:S1 family peptidase n=1 Tax=Glaciecola sp. SC05 TaxID=1987355 RepID=UPI003527B302